MLPLKDRPTGMTAERDGADGNSWKQEVNDEAFYTPVWRCGSPIARDA